MKATNLFLLTLFTLSLTGCIAMGNGQRISHFTPFKSSGHGAHRSVFKNQYVVNYTYEANKSKDSVTLKGQFSCLKGTADWDYSQGALTALLVASDKTIVDKQVLTTWAQEELCQPKEFNKTLPLHANVSGIALHLSANMAE